MFGSGRAALNALDRRMAASAIRSMFEDSTDASGWSCRKAHPIMSTVRTHLLRAIAFSTCVSGLLWSQLQSSAAALDSDRDGISDEVEQQLLQQFAPEFMVGSNDCAALPAEF